MIDTDTSSPAANFASRSLRRTLGTCTAVAATDLFTTAAATLTTIRSGDLVEVAAGTLTGGAGIVVGTEYVIEIVSATTFKLRDADTGVYLNVTSDLTAGGSLIHGRLTLANSGQRIGTIVH